MRLHDITTRYSWYSSCPCGFWTPSGEFCTKICWFCEEWTNFWAVPISIHDRIMAIHGNPWQSMAWWKASHAARWRPRWPESPASASGSTSWSQETYCALRNAPPATPQTQGCWCGAKWCKNRAMQMHGEGVRVSTWILPGTPWNPQSGTSSFPIFSRARRSLGDFFGLGCHRSHRIRFGPSGFTLHDLEIMGTWW